MNRKEFNDWFYKNIVMTKCDDANGIFEFTIDGRSFTTKKGKPGITCLYYVSVYETTSGKKCVATRILGEHDAVEGTIYAVLYKQMGVTNV